MTTINLDELLKKVAALKASGEIDLSLEEDLSIAIMNLISLEEHFYFTSQKTGQNDYLDLMKEVREARKILLKRLMSRHEGETWCISKHLLATTMRLIEVGAKLQTKGQEAEAREMWAQAHQIYSLFWLLRFKLMNDQTAEKSADDKPDSIDPNEMDHPWSRKELLNKLIDCCGE